jgi:hypothetical protein
MHHKVAIPATADGSDQAGHATSGQKLDQGQVEQFLSPGGFIPKPSRRACELFGYFGTRSCSGHRDQNARSSQKSRQYWQNKAKIRSFMDQRLKNI